MEKYKQCKFQNGDAFTTSWTPSWAAKKGNTMNLKIDDEWTEGWKVVEVFDLEIDEKQLQIQDRASRKTREVLGV